jgi:Protein of unknown function (DUF3558)
MKNDLKMLIRAATCVAGIILIASSCSTTASGRPTPQPTSSLPIESTPVGHQSDEVPRVADPLDATRFLAQPCATLTEAQLASLAITRPGIPTTTGAIAERSGPYCTWIAAEELRSAIGLGFDTGNRDGLSDNYRAHDQFAYFEPTTVANYPAVFADRDDLRPQGLCIIVVGITDTLTFSVSEDGELDQQGACDRAKQVAAAALVTMGGDG